MRKHNSLIAGLIGVMAVVVTSSSAFGVLNTKHGRWMQRDPVGYVDGMNQHEYAGSDPVNHTDPNGMWKREAPGSHVWVVEREEDTLEELAWKVEYGGNPDNWPCLWPTKDTEDHGYPLNLCPCDKYDASNLAAKSGPSLYINFDANNIVYQYERPQAYSARTGLEVYHLLKTKSKQGASPLHYFEIDAHGGNSYMVAPGNKESRIAGYPEIGKIAFNPRAYPPSSPRPTFSRAQSKQGPHRCWFTRSADGYSLACGGKYFGETFAASFLRTGAQINTSPKDMKIYSTWRYEAYGPTMWGFGDDEAKVKWHDGLDLFLKNAKEWVAIPGGL